MCRAGAAVHRVPRAERLPGSAPRPLCQPNDLWQMLSRASECYPPLPPESTTATPDIATHTRRAHTRAHTHAHAHARAQRWTIRQCNAGNVASVLLIVDHIALHVARRRVSAPHAMQDFNYKPCVACNFHMGQKGTKTSPHTFAPTLARRDGLAHSALAFMRELAAGVHRAGRSVYSAVYSA
jgi:hypothetical protein